MTRQQLEEKTVAELRDMVVKADLPGRSAWTTKDQFIDALVDEPTKEQKQEKARTTAAEPDYPKKFPLAGMTIKGEHKENTVGLFQTEPGVKEHMTAEEARSKGFYVAPTHQEKAKTVKKG